ncbi:multiple sugar transport system substrate-binding protein [Leifsonia sp. 98AMF]|uniref:sugar ABC transporter substrate-binding protein n=1 Tax=Microbacteriaceae TaxID=85023 RepID=UPI00037C53E7|nr:MULTISPECIES: extracellular solute-binding protein [Microbacteriaceae]SDH09169.1 multiple sugar transport system substrate-binding protein [Leifsonia sp. 197AMF]SDJ30285.1 multiple sugar transport system substrate-binding protein [Leifsonia sp. 466MF]SDK50011.1 multiple sugar transport system substrate-binding protein [Leifsonia sp. 157MF]SDN51967.1 multiple sugar transport system substrate-binding protein [Leifsonia sp. 509MF]SEN58206.1 multiple sugar transport system substrate-binding pro
MITKKTSRLLGAAVVAAAVVAGVAACSGSGSGSSGSAGGTYTFWDPYPQFDASADWTKLVEQCGTEAGVTVKRTGYDTSDLTNKALLAGQQGSSPDLLLVDNPVVSTLAEAGILTTTSENKLDTSDIQKNILAAGQLDGKTYGVPIGANTLALYYNKAVLSAAGVDASSIKDWSTLTDALAKVTAAGKKGITFSAIGTEEGSFQFLPWFWGSGANLTKLDSDKAEQALSLWTDWVKKGYAPNSVINNTQTTSWQEFATGDFAFGENGTWQLGNVKKAGIDYGILSIPAMDGGAAPAPTGGEFMTLPVQKDTARYATSKKIAECLTSTKSFVKTDTTLSYIAPTEAAQKEQVAANPELQPWVDAVAAAKGRTSDDLGTKYPKISKELWTAVQNALSGAQSPADALKAAQTAAAAATK